ncbi:MAG: hypothetical protein WDW38_001151 [Sanguina aurantia]
MVVPGDTFRGTLNASLLRNTLYQKNAGAVEHLTNNLVHVESPVSGVKLTSTSTRRNNIRDPICGAVLHYDTTVATVTAPVRKQQMLHSRSFFLTKDVDLTIQTLRSTTKINRYTNEKVGTAGTPTGLDTSLIAYKKATEKC